MDLIGDLSWRIRWEQQIVIGGNSFFHCLHYIVRIPIDLSPWYVLKFYPGFLAQEFITFLGLFASLACSTATPTVCLSSISMAMEGISFISVAEMAAIPSGTVIFFVLPKAQSISCIHTVALLRL
jgi:hypothetical protein